MTTATEMPAWLDQHHAELNRAARECYGLRNAAKQSGRSQRAQDHEETGDVYFLRSLAITAEWEE